MNGVSSRSRIILFGAVFIVALLALLPMRTGMEWLGLSDRGVAARSADGSVWNGQLIESQFGDAALGNVDAGLNLFPLMLGRARVAVARSPDNAAIFGDFRGTISVSGISDMNATLPADWLFAPLPVSALELENVTVEFDNGQCADADGLVRARIGGSLGGIALPEALVGNAACEDDALLLPLISQSGMEQMDVRILADGDFSAELRITVANEDARQQLAQSGFAPGPNGYQMSVQGRF
ncbi:type II secretion system protein N [Parasphingopyxis sp. CP4]|uniref:type II secretion system protein N n=1 Tax=Parasphingopyxis sp. CP4 TaxID=2724527 RepID=UPI0015A1521D|nr:type II secretion system protein N [Parasphingopyxis sp. CP4]QLC21291.1 type II secretion system protein N [Parasphingopyxis sp. CP4]